MAEGEPVRQCHLSDEQVMKLVMGTFDAEHAGNPAVEYLLYELDKFFSSDGTPDLPAAIQFLKDISRFAYYFRCSMDHLLGNDGPVPKQRLDVAELLEKSQQRPLSSGKDIIYKVDERGLATS